MAKRALEVSVEELREGIVAFRLQGDLYGNRLGYEFQNEVRERITAGCRRIAIDLAGVQRVDSSGIGILVSTSVSAQNAGCGLVLCSLTSHVEHLLSLVWFQKWVDHAPSLADAMSKLEALDPADPAG